MQYYFSNTQVSEVFKIPKEGRENLKTSGVCRREPTDLFLKHCFRKDLQKNLAIKFRKEIFYC
jgi:hypothetical protein